MTVFSSLSEYTDQDVIALLKKIPQAYRDWINSKRAETGDLDRSQKDGRSKSSEV